MEHTSTCRWIINLYSPSCKIFPLGIIKHCTIESALLLTNLCFDKKSKTREYIGLRKTSDLNCFKCSKPMISNCGPRTKRPGFREDMAELQKKVLKIFDHSFIHSRIYIH